MPGNTTALAGLRFFLVVLSCNGDGGPWAMLITLAYICVALVSLPLLGERKIKKS